MWSTVLLETRWSNEVYRLLRILHSIWSCLCFLPFQHALNFIQWIAEMARVCMFSPHSCYALFPFHWQVYSVHKPNPSPPPPSGYPIFWDIFMWRHKYMVSANNVFWDRPLHLFFLTPSSRPIEGLKHNGRINVGTCPHKDYFLQRSALTKVPIKHCSYYC
jgi:hypothetical protein